MDLPEGNLTWLRVKATIRGWCRKVRWCLSGGLTRRETESLLILSQNMWRAETPDGKEIVWIPGSDDCLGGDIQIVSKLNTIIETIPLRLNYYQKLPATNTNPHSAKMALEILYSGKGAIKYSGNVPDFADVTVKIPSTAVE